MSIAPRVSLCMIVRDEEKNLKSCLDPVAHLFDEIVVIDTGSTDRTRQVAADLGASVFEFPWCDSFAAARNESLNRATGDWVFWLDADDRLDGTNVRRLAELLATLHDQRHAFLMPCLSVPSCSADPTHVDHLCRLFRRLPEVRWERRVHEQILPSIERTGHLTFLSDVQILHLGYRDPVLDRRKMSRNLRLLHMEYATDPTDSFTLWHLGLVSMRQGQYGEALTYLLYSHKHAVKHHHWVRSVYASLCEVLARLGRLEEALAMAGEGLQRFANDPVLLTRRAALLHARGDLGEAERCLLYLLHSATETQMYTGDQAILDHREARYQLGMIYRDQGRHNEAERVFQEMLARHPDYLLGWYGLGWVYVVQRKLGNVEYAAKQLEKLPHGGTYASLLRGEWCLALGELDRAQEFLTQTIAQAPRMVWPRVLLGDLLLMRGADHETCISAQRDILHVDPGNVRAMENLETLSCKGRFQPAASSLWFSTTI